MFVSDSEAFAHSAQVEECDILGKISEQLCFMAYKRCSRKTTIINGCKGEIAGKELLAANMDGITTKEERQINKQSPSISETIMNILKNIL